jgi:hypothetical protein
MLRSIKTAIVLAVITLIFSACDKDKPTNPDTLSTISNIAGSLALYDRYGNKITNERMMVYMESTTGIRYSGESQKDGSYLVLNVPYANNYTISFEKSGFGTYKIFGYDHESTGNIGTIEGPIRLSEKSSTICKTLVTVQKTDTVEFHMALEGGDPGENRKIRLLFHTISQIDHRNYAHATPKFTISGNNQVVTLTKALLSEYGLTSGSVYFVQVYGDSYYSNSYYDESSQKTMLPNLGYSETEGVPTASFTMP